jgi:cysteinyl-tRNA synthetase
MDDDFNTPDAFAVLFDLANEVNRTGAADRAARLRALGGVLGLLERDAEEYLRGDLPEGWSREQIEQLIAARAGAKKAKNYAEADRIRKALADAGIALEDTPQGTTWRRA